MIEQNCGFCGKSYLSQRSNHRKFCSQSCATKFQWKNRSHFAVQCQNCGKPMILTAYWAGKRKYCSYGCYWERRRGYKPSETRVLQIDGVTFLATPRYDELMEESTAINEEYSKHDSHTMEAAELRRRYRAIGKKMAKQLRVVQVKPLDEY